MQGICFGFIPGLMVTIRFASLVASAQLDALAVPKANRGSPDRTFPGIVSSASALHVQVYSHLGLADLDMVLSPSKINHKNPALSMSSDNQR
jgi:hypothetical protein